MKIQALADRTPLNFPDGGAMLVHREPTEVPKEYEADVRRILAAGVFGIFEVTDKMEDTIDLKKNKEA